MIPEVLVSVKVLCWPQLEIQILSILLRLLKVLWK